jgi:hypothetical protein
MNVGLIIALIVEFSGSSRVIASGVTFDGRNRSAS